MKKFFWSVIFCLMAVVTTNAQGHLKFNGVEIDGNLTSFVEKMVEKGFTEDSVKLNDYGVWMTGKFVNKDVKLHIASSRQTKTVYSVSVWLKNTSQTRLKLDYYKLVELFTDKYGEPKKRVDYDTIFSVENGGIMISLSDDEISIMYIDNANRGIERKEFNDYLKKEEEKRKEKNSQFFNEI